MTRDYEQFCSAVIEALGDYARDGDSRHLQTVASAFAALPDPHDSHPADVRWRVVGWSGRTASVSARTLGRENPGWRIRVRRAARPDIATGRWRRPGFEVIATARYTAKPFRFVVADDAGATPSTSAVRSEMRELGWKIRGKGSPAVYIDDITRSPVVDARADRWIDGLVSEYPGELWEFADSSEGAAWRERLAKALEVAASPHWADRYRLTLGTGYAVRSELRLLKVSRPIAHDHAPPDGLEVPLLERHGDIVLSRGSGRTAPAPGTTWLAVEAVVLEGGGTVTSGDKLVCYELAADPSNAFVAGQWSHVYGAKSNTGLALVERAIESPDEIAEAILIGGRADENWYHWLVDYLPRILEVPERIPANIPVLVSSRVPAQGLEALRELTRRPVLIRDPGIAMRVGLLHVAAPAVQLLDDPRIPWENGFALRPSSLRRLRDQWGIDETPAPNGRRIFLSRRSGIRRGIGNEAELVEVAESAGLEIIDPARLSFAEQRALFGEASLVIGGSGAVMANYLFLRPGTKVVALTSRQLWDFVMPAALASLVGADFRYLTGPSSVALADVRSRSEWIHAPFTINPALLEVTLAHLRAP